MILNSLFISSISNLLPSSPLPVSCRVLFACSAHFAPTLTLRQLAPFPHAWHGASARDLLHACLFVSIGHIFALVARFSMINGSSAHVACCKLPKFLSIRSIDSAVRQHKQRQRMLWWLCWRENLLCKYCHYSFTMVYVVGLLHTSF